jgi:hypothetical protein
MTADFVDKLHQSDFIVYGSNLDSAAHIRQSLNLGVDSLSTGHLEMALQIRDRALKDFSRSYALRGNEK